MATGIEAEMARFEQEVLGNDSRPGRGRHGPNMPDIPPPPFMQHYDMPGRPMPGPMPGHDMMMGPGPMPMGPGPMMMGPDFSMAAQPKVYAAPPQITKRKAEPEPAAVPSKISAEAPSSSSDPSTSGVNFANTYFTPRATKVSTGLGTPSAFNQATAASGYDTAKVLRKKKIVRTAAGKSWEDPTLLEWDPNDYRIFCGDLGNEVTDDVLARVFNKYTSFQKAKVVREKQSKKSKGYGFVSFKDPNDFIRAMREMNGKYVGNRPIKLRKSNWKDRNIDIVRKKMKEKKKLGYKV